MHYYFSLRQDTHFRESVLLAMGTSAQAPEYLFSLGGYRGFGDYQSTIQTINPCFESFQTSNQLLIIPITSICIGSKR